MKTKNLISTLAIFLIAGNSYSQDISGDFKPSGRAFMKIYTNYHSTWTDGESDKVFEIQRAYFGYQAQFSEYFSGRLTLDVGDPSFGDLEMTAYLKHAFAQYRKDRFTAKLGMIGLHQFKLQEDLWAGRYLYKSFMDEHRFGPSADLGIFLAYQVHNVLSVDFTIANGEGYKRVEADTILKYSIGTTISPLEGLDFRASYDHMGKDSAQQTLAFYAGYRADKFSVGAEYMHQLNHRRMNEQDLAGISIFGSYYMDKIRIFGRFDQLSSSTIGSATDPWNIANDGQVIIAGIELSPVRGIIITPNYQGWIPAGGGSMSHSPYLSLEINF